MFYKKRQHLLVEIAIFLVFAWHRILLKAKAFNRFCPNVSMNLKEEEIRWRDVIEQYKAEIGMSLIEINSLSLERVM